MDSFQAMGMAIGRDAELIADTLDLKAVTIRRWKEDPHQSGSRNPADTLRIVMQTALDAGRSVADALAPLRYLESCFEARSYSGARLHEVQANFMTEVCHLMMEYAATIREGTITPNELRRMRREIAHIREQLSDLEQCIERSCEVERVAG